MAAIITLIMQLLPLILRLFGLGAAGWAGLNYSALATASPEGVALASGTTAYYVGGPIASMFAFLSAASGVDWLKRRGTQSAGNLIEVVAAIISFLKDHPEAFDFILQLINLLKSQGIDTSQIEGAVKAARAAK